MSDQSQQACDLLVIGGGVLGTFHAYHAARSGLKVAVLEQHLAPRGATTRNFGQVVPSGMAEPWQTLGRRSLEIYSGIQDQFDISVRQNGSIYLASNDEEVTLIDELAALNETRGYQSERWSAEKCRNKYPNLRADYCRGGLYFPQEVSVNPRQMIHRLHRFLEEQCRVEFFYQRLAVRLEENIDGTSTVLTSNGTSFSAEKVVVCSGSEFQTLFPELFKQSALEVVKLQMLRLAPLMDVSMPGNILTGLSIRRYESFAECPSYQTIVRHQPEESFWKKWGVHILFKQEADGSIILGDSHEYAPAARADDLDFDLREDINRYFLEEARKIFDLPSWEIEAAWYGLYSQTDEEGGIFQRQIGERIHIVTGIGGKGMTGSAAFAEKHIKEITR